MLCWTVSLINLGNVSCTNAPLDSEWIGLSLVTGAEEAEEVTRQWLEKKFGGKLKKARVNDIRLSEGMWNIKADISIRKGALSTASHSITMKVDAGTGKVVSYSESEEKE